MKPYLKAERSADFTQKIVIDANTWIRYVGMNKQETLFMIMQSYRLLVICNNYLLHEIFNACIENEWYTSKQAFHIIMELKKMVYGTTETAIFRLSKDPKDNYIFDLAIQNNCRFIVSDDRLLRETSLKPIPVRTTSWFIKHYPPPRL